MPACLLLAGEPSPLGANEQRFGGASFQLAHALAAGEVEAAADVPVGGVAVGVLLMRLHGELLERLARRGPPEGHSGAVGEPLGYELEVTLLQQSQGVDSEGMSQLENADS